MCIPCVMCGSCCNGGTVDGCCPECGNEVPDDTLCCPFCHTILNLAAASQPEGTERDRARMPARESMQRTSSDMMDSQPPAGGGSGR